ncbi:hypothetical protein EKQ61_01485 [Staphylococcus gallinarum]|uniref:Phage protein n=1 Tax=Staphylococcus gallinarum TaxID=1293 RepID=A0A0D0QU90_STAGA|nr:hypothetical protein [Staphylococcus gallinarum]KIR10661.1 hypothetical protein SH09_10865 [Staphylococcus gallinarum]RTX82866.1 hypothetical protein EKQ61_01485 [Staphylococcus gallinarum]GEQ04550.1 hypothetical protein SGA02_03780 [Staphylococcus gallinarum]SUM32105.1 phage protein [Staphylococcus gallinarum]
MTNALDTLIALSKEYIRVLEERKKENLEYGFDFVSETRVERTGLVLRQAMLDFEKGRMKND